ncbi:MAG: zinc ribbon domain-containing protein, partial [Steroidobacteraceae bacterium]
MATIPFTNNYTDLSSNRGYQFKFFCQKCGNGYQSTFQANKLGTAANAAQAVSSLLGGIFTRAAQAGESLQQMVAGPQHDAALKSAVEEIRPIFKQCSRCGQSVCEPVCWNGKAGLCETCAPDLDEEVASAQAQAAKAQVIEKAQKIDFVGQRSLAQVTA